jgi:DNA replication and repair protein RecF
MFLSTLELKNFRNHKEIKLSFEKNITLIIGDNGLGKTNLLEAIYFVSSAKSHRTNSQDDMIRWGSDYGLIRANTGSRANEIIASNVQENKYLIELELNPPNRIKIRLNKVAVKKKSDFVSILPSVIFSPDDLSIIKGGPSLRRSWMDNLLEKIYPDYYHLCLRYQKILNQRNSLIKSLNNEKNHMTNATLETWDENLVKYGSEIILKRTWLAREIKEDFSRYFGIFFNNADAGLEYIYSWERSGPSNNYHTVNDDADLRVLGGKPLNSMEDYKNNFHANNLAPAAELAGITVTFREKLKQNFSRELGFKNTLTGPHRDDLSVLLSGKPVKSFGSQGQQRIAAVCLKFCELEILKKKLGKNPVLLLDDVLSELDSKRESQVLNLIGDSFQTFITTSNINYLNDFDAINSKNIKKFLVTAESVSEIRTNRKGNRPPSLK